MKRKIIVTSFCHPILPLRRVKYEDTIRKYYFTILPIHTISGSNIISISIAYYNIIHLTFDTRKSNPEKNLT